MIAVRPHGAAPLTHSDRAFLRAHRHSTDGPESLSELSSEARALISAEWADLMRKRKFAKGKEASGGWSAGWDGPPGERLKELAANCVALLILMQRCSDEGRVPREEDFDLLLRNLRPKHHVNEQAYESICESTTTIYRELVRAHASSANGGAAH